MTQVKPKSPAVKAGRNTRINSPNAEPRDTRAMNERSQTEDRALSDDERVEMFRQQFLQSALPDLPPIPGYHTCWCTTTNPRDTIHTRMRLGYEPIRVEDIPGWEYTSIKTGEWTGFVGVNEMLAMKLPTDLYLKYMKAVHHDAPKAEEEKLASNIEVLKDQVLRAGGKLLIGDGDADLGKDDRPAKFDD